MTGILLENIYINNHKRLHPSARKINYSLATEHARGHLDGIKNGTINYIVDGEKELETANLEQIIAYFAK